MRAAEYDITIEQGATFLEQFGWTQANGTPVNLTGHDLFMQVRPFKESDVVLLAGQIVSGVASGAIEFAVLPAFGTWTIEIDSTVTELLDFTQAYYDIEDNTGAAVIRIVEGKVTLSKEVTR